MGRAEGAGGMAKMLGDVSPRPPYNRRPLAVAVYHAGLQAHVRLQCDRSHNVHYGMKWDTRVLGCHGTLNIVIAAYRNHISDADIMSTFAPVCQI